MARLSTTADQTTEQSVVEHRWRGVVATLLVVLAALSAAVGELLAVEQ